jgi:hypothetical protein
MDFDAKTLAGVVISAEPLSKDQFEKVKAKIQSVTDPSAKLLLSQKVSGVARFFITFLIVFQSQKNIITVP